MSLRFLGLALTIFGANLIVNCKASDGGPAPPPLVYPAAPRANTVDHYHGVAVSDPFRPLEDPDAPSTRAWIDAQNKLAFGFLESIPKREAIRRRLTELWDYEKYDVPSREGGRYFYDYNTGLQNQSVLYTAESLDGKPRVLLDPNALSPDGTVALAGVTVSKDGKRLAYGIAGAGSDWNVWKVRDVETGKDLPDEVNWIKFSAAQWSPDGQGFYYGRFPEPKPGDDLRGANYHQKVYYHRLGAKQSDDQLVWEDNEHRDWRADPIVTDDGKYLILTIGKGTDDKYRVLYRPLDRPERKPIHLVGDFEADYTFIDNDGPIFWFKTDVNAPRGRVIAIDTRKPQREHWVELIPQARETLVTVDNVGNRFFVTYLKDAYSVVRMFDESGRHVSDVALPGIGTAAGFDGKRREQETFYEFTSFNTPAAIYRYDLATGRSKLWRQPALKFDPRQYVTTQVFYTSKDGTKIPMFLSRKSGPRFDTIRPTVLYGYGGFRISLTPSFSPSVLAWMEMGGLYAQPNLRGGGEYGEEWHQAGTKLKKQNVFDDFLAAAEWLIANNYTSRPKLAIAGGSNGGLLVGACLTQRPDLFGAALPAVGVMDMLRFHKFTIGWAWVDDYGSSDDAEQFRSIYAYSPLHHIKPGTCYPPTLITTADHDDRVVPAHSFKFAAALQAAQSCDNPILIRIETKAGHGAGKPTSKQVDEAADKWAFLVKILKLDLKDGAKSPIQKVEKLAD
jgi:prolyl oligopeptidase